MPLSSEYPAFLRAAIQDVPALPQAVRDVLRLSQQPEVEFSRIVEVITSDEALTGRMLQVANSALFGLQRQVRSIQQATVLLGRMAVVQLALGVSVMNLETTRQSDLINRQAFWQHSMSIALLGRFLARQVPAVNPDEAFTIGLLHDIGKLLLLEHFGETYTALCEQAQQHPEKPLHVIEREALGADHATAGKALCEHWKLSDELIATVAHHHDPVTEDTAPMVVLLGAANVIAKAMDVGWTGNPYLPCTSGYEELLRSSLNHVDMLRSLPEEVRKVQRTIGEEGGISSSVITAPVEEPPVVHVQLDASMLAEVLALLIVALGATPAPLAVKSSTIESPDGADLVIVDRAPARQGGDGPDNVLNVRAWIEQQPYDVNTRLHVGALRTWVQRGLAAHADTVTT